MAWVDTDSYRNGICTFRVLNREDESEVYLEAVDFRSSFFNGAVVYPELDNVAFSQLPEADYQQRLSAFKAYHSTRLKSLYPEIAGEIVFTNPPYGLIV